MPALPGTGDHFIVCGDGPLAYRITEELTSRYREQVTVIVPSRRRNHAPRIRALPGVRVIERTELTSDAFRDAGVEAARAVALLWTDDILNFHAALRAQDLNPGLRLVITVFNRRLGQHFRGFFTDCTVVSGTSMATPSFIAAALGEPAPSHVRVSGRTLYVARREDVLPEHVVCGLAAVPGDPAGATRLLPPDELPDASGASWQAEADGEPGMEPWRGGPGRHGGGLVLAVANGTPRDPLARRRHPVRTAARVARRLAWNKFGVVFGALLAATLTGFLLLFLASGYSFSNALYLTVMDMTGSALTQAALAGPEKISQVVLTVDGMAFIPVVTAIIVGARLTGSIRPAPRPSGGHIIVAGLGNVGMHIVGELHDLGFDVVCVDPDPAARGVPMARRLGLPVVIGDAFSEETLRTAGVATSSALISVTSSDIVNLETALQARALREDLRIVLRLFDDDLAQRVQKTVGNIVSRSVSYMAAPAFAAAMLEHQVLRTIAVGRHVLLISDIRVEPGADLVGQPLEELERGGLARILALEIRGTALLDWSPHRGYLLAASDRVIVVATRAGLSRFLAGNRPAMPSSQFPSSSASSQSPTSQWQSPSRPTS